MPLRPARPFAALFLAGLLVGCAATAPSPGEPAATVERFVPERPPAVPDTTRAEQAFVRGLTLLRIGDPEAALPLFEEARRLAPGEPAVLAALADAHAALDALDTALFYAEAARAAAPDNPHVHRQAARLYRDAGQTEAAAAALDAVVALDADDYEALFELGALRSVQGDYEAALDAYTRLRALLGDLPDVLEPLLSVHLRRGDEAGVEATLEALVGTAPADPEPYRMLADLYAGRGELEEAARVLRTLLRNAPGNAEAADALTDLQRRLGLPAAGEGTGTAAPSETPPADPAEEARRLRRALDANPRDLDGWARAADAYLVAGEPDDALAVAEEALLLFPGQPSLLERAARAALAADRPGLALGHAREAEQILAADGGAPERRAALLLLVGDAYARQGEPDEARSAWQLARTLDPANAELRDRLGDGMP